MAKEKTINGRTYYQCEECKFYYTDKIWAEKCQAWCNEKHSCNIEITKHSVNPNEKENEKCC